jgi:hypothetical protein
MEELRLGGQLLPTANTSFSKAATSFSDKYRIRIELMAREFAQRMSSRSMFFCDLVSISSSTTHGFWST